MDNTIKEGFKEGICMEIARVTTKGQITIPVNIRKLMNIKEGDKIVFFE